VPIARRQDSEEGSEDDVDVGRGVAPGKVAMVGRGVGLFVGAFDGDLVGDGVLVGALVT